MTAFQSSPVRIWNQSCWQWWDNCRNCRKTGIIFDTNVRLQTQTSVTDTAAVLLLKKYRINVTIKRFLFSVNAVKKVSGEWRVYCKVPLSVTELQWIIDAFGSSPTMDLLISGSVRDKLWIISSSSVSLLFNLCLNIKGDVGQKDNELHFDDGPRWSV